MKTKADRFWPLFVAIDFDTFSDEICAVVHLDLIAKANTELTYLPVYLQAQFGKLDLAVVLSGMSKGNDQLHLVQRGA